MVQRKVGIFFRNKVATMIYGILILTVNIDTATLFYVVVLLIRLGIWAIVCDLSQQKRNNDKLFLALLEDWKREKYFQNFN